MNDDNNSKIRSLAKAFIIVDLLAEKKTEMSLAEISKYTGMKKTTAHGLISTLKDFGYIEQSCANSNYRLGTRFFEIGNIVANRWDIRSIAHKYLEGIASDLGETVHLSVLNRNQALCIDKYEAKRNYSLVTSIGTRMPAYCTGTGKALLAYQDSEMLADYLSNTKLVKYAPNTITDTDELIEELKTVKMNGYALDKCEMLTNIICIGVPIFSYGGVACAAASVSFCISERTNDIWQKRALDEIIGAARKISIEMGFSDIKPV